MKSSLKPTISVLVGSVRQGRQSITVANHVAKTLQQRGNKVHLIDPQQFPSIHIFQERYRFLKNPNQDLVKLHQLLSESDAFVGVTPEYNYSYSPIIKQILDVYFNEFKYKPIGIVGYSMGPFAGVRAIEQLKLTSVALGLTPIPAYLAVPAVHTQYDENGNLKEESLRTALDSMLHQLDWYTAALSNHRQLDPPKLP